MSHDHVHWIPGEILPYFAVRHVHLCHLEPELEILQKFGTLYYTKMKNTCQTREKHVSRVWDHVHWIPGKILPHFYVLHLSVGHLEPKLEICKYLEQAVLYHTVL